MHTDVELAKVEASTSKSIPKPPRTASTIWCRFGANLRRLRLKRGLSLERLGKLSGVTRDAEPVELAYSGDHNDLAHATRWRCRSARCSRPGRPPTQVLRGSQANADQSRRQLQFARALPVNPGRTSFTSCACNPGWRSPRHADGTIESLVVSGSVSITVGEAEPAHRGRGPVYFQANVRTLPERFAQPALLYLVCTTRKNRQLTSPRVVSCPTRSRRFVIWTE